MKKFEELDKRGVHDVEKSIIEKWKKNDIFKKSILNRENNDSYVFYDGPATANGNPGLHHMVAKFLKDSFCKYETMKGNKVIRKVGWDTHGLPVEVQVEKELGFDGKKDIEKYGIREFNQKCRESVWKNVDAFNKLTDEMGQFIDLENPYITYDNDYIETEWWILKKFFDEGLFYKGVKIVPWCPRCGTGLASHEVSQGYENVTVNTVIVPFKKCDEDVYFLVWTTTPWTLISNVALCVNPKEVYVKVKSKGYQFILAKALVDSVLGSDYEVLEEYKGKDLEYTKYEQLIPALSVLADKESFIVTCDEYVTMTDGTGIVHIAPAFGEDDAKVGKKYNLSYLNPVGEDGKYTDGFWKGMLVFDADIEVIKWLKENDKLFKKQKLEHEYPHCWRCHSPLVYYSRPSYYLEVTKIKDKIINENNKVNWYPSFVGEKRFGNWLLNMSDWAISRNRYWGTPLPLWTCECGHYEMIGSREELCDKATSDIDVKNLDLHRPFVDDISIKCPCCGKEMKRVEEVIDCWFDSGAMPFAQYHYPFENKELWDNQFPADFICEGIDQTRGWFYSLLVISTFVTGKSPYKNVLVNELLLDKNGHKMHKSKGNAIEPFTLMDQYGSDTIRWYIPYVSPVWTPLKFNEDDLKEIHSKFFNPLKNTYTFFQTYANIDHIDIDDCYIDVERREEIDKWLLSKYNRLVRDVTMDMEQYDLNQVVKKITHFVSDDLSNWYIRRNRNRFWASEMDNSKRAVYMTTYEVLVGLCKLCAPIIPFTTEEIYQKLTGNESVHLEDYPVSVSDYIDDELEEKMDLVIKLISLGRNAREEAKIKVRQPLSNVILDKNIESIIGDIDDLIKEELNVKDIVYLDDLSEYMNIEYKPNFKVCGKIFGKDMKRFSDYLSDISKEEIKLLEGGKLVVNFNGHEYDVKLEYVDKKIHSREGYDVAVEDNCMIILNTQLTDELIGEGLARETISKIQNLRKASGFEIMDRICIYYHASSEYCDKIKDFVSFIQKETLGVDMKFVDDSFEVYDINGYEVGFRLEKIK